MANISAPSVNGTGKTPGSTLSVPDLRTGSGGRLGLAERLQIGVEL